MSYDVKVVGVEQIDNNALYRLCITDLNTMESREIRVRYSYLYDLHQRLTGDNQHYQFPSFPKKDTFNNLIRKKDEEVLKARQQQIGVYFTELLKQFDGSRQSLPQVPKALLEFLRDGYDNLRYTQLTKEFSSKKDVLKDLQFQKIKELRKGPFGKSTLVRAAKDQQFVLHKFYVPAQHAEPTLANYLKSHLYINDHSIIAQVQHIFQIKPKLSLLDSLIGSPKVPTISKKTPFKMFYQANCEVQKIYSLECYEGQNLDEVIRARIQQKKHFSQEEILNLAQKIVQGVLLVQKKTFYNKLMGTNVLLNRDQVKLTGISEPNERYKDKLILEGFASRTDKQYDSIYYPPERHMNNQYSPSKVDAWQFGIVLLKACLLKSNLDLDGIHNSSSLVRQLAESVTKRYGDVIANIIELCLKNQSTQRAELKDIQFMLNQTSMVEFKSTYFGQDSQRAKVERKTIFALSQETKAQMMDLIEKQQMKYLNLKVNLSGKAMVLDDFKDLVSNLGNLCEVNELNLILDKSDRPGLCNILSTISDFKYLVRLILDLKGQELTEADKDEIIAFASTHKSLKSLILDLSNTLVDNEFLSRLQKLQNLPLRLKLYY